MDIIIHVRTLLERCNPLKNTALHSVASGKRDYEIQTDTEDGTLHQCVTLLQTVNISHE